MRGPRTYALYRFSLGAILFALIVAFGTVELASDALDSGAAVPGTLPRDVPIRFGLTVYHVLDAIAPAPYVETTLAQEALSRADAGAAERYALRLPESPTRDEILARVASMRGERVLAREYFLAAPDPAAVHASANTLAVRNPAAGYALERLLQVRLDRDATHPDAVGEAYWHMGRLANQEAWVQVPGSTRQREWLREALRDFEAAVKLAPLSERYLVEAANQANLLGDRRRAEQLFADAADVDPASADAVAGLGVVAWENGDRQSAQGYLARARTLDPRALMVGALERDLR